MWYLAIVVIATVLLYYELYIGGAVAPKILTGYGMTFPFYVYISVVGNAIGAFGSLLAGLGDRWGRANLTAYGLVLTALLALFGIPNAGDKWSFAILSVIIGLVEGVILVATPALVRDFSPQLGRASAMGFWTLGPVIGSLVVAVVSTNTVNHLGAWQDQYIICGVVGLIVGLVALFGLRELSPRLRDQLMVSLHDRALIEAKARGINPEEAMGKSHWRQMMHLDVVGSAFAISVFLLVYYAAVGFFTIYFTTLFGYSLSKANSIGNWFWAFDAGVLIITGIISDRFRVRKPFMVVGGIGAIVMTIVFLNEGATTSYGTIVLTISVLAAFLAIAYAPWMASFTETVEKHNPALIATGLAVWGWIIRVVVALSALFLPLVVNSMTPLVTYGAQVSTYATQYSSEIAFATAHADVVATAQKIPPAVLGDAQKVPASVITTAQSIPANVTATAAKIPASVLATAQKDSTQLANAVKFQPELAVIQANPTLFAKLQADPTNKALQAQAIAAAGGGAKGLAVLQTIGANQAAIAGVIAVGSELQTVQPYFTDLATIAPYSTQLQTIAPYSAELTAMAPFSAQLTTIAPYSAQLTALSKVPAGVFPYLQAHASAVQTAAKNAPGQWKTWWWVCVGGEVLFLPFIFLMTGRWSPRKAKQDADEHEAKVQAELAALQEA
jgi:MFS transporter, ACS family, D-galactonate transporter